MAVNFEAHKMALRYFSEQKILPSVGKTRSHGKRSGKMVLVLCTQIQILVDI